ncbi:MAG TPA: hypothetical protein VGC10_05210 [Sphingomonas sp.]
MSQVVRSATQASNKARQASALPAGMQRPVPAANPQRAILDFTGDDQAQSGQTDPGLAEPAQVPGGGGQARIAPAQYPAVSGRQPAHRSVRRVAVGTAGFRFIDAALTAMG